MNNKISEEVRRFSERMQFRLNKNKHKDCEVMNPDSTVRRWADCAYDWLLKRIKDEVKELEDSLEILDTNSTPETMSDAANECADVANFAMMIADKLTTL